MSFARGKKSSGMSSQEATLSTALRLIAVIADIRAQVPSGAQQAQLKEVEADDSTLVCNGLGSLESAVGFSRSSDQSCADF